MRSTDGHPKWLQGVFLHGFEDENDGNTDEDDGDNDGDSDGDEDEDSDNSSGGEGDTAGLKSALRKERKARRDFEKRFKALEKQQQTKDEQDQDELTRTKAERDAEKERTAKLAEGFVTTKVDNAVLREAQGMKFINPSNALALVDRGLIEVEQDDDDPSSVDLDKESVKDALKQVAKENPHLLVAEGDENASGGKFGGSRNTGSNEQKRKNQQEKVETDLYPAMRNRRK